MSKDELLANSHLIDTNALMRPKEAQDERSIAAQFFHSAVYSGIQAPAEGLTQFVNKAAQTVTGNEKTTVLPNMHFEAPKQADFGSAAWHVQQIGGGVGMLVPFLAVNKGVGSVIGRNATAVEAAFLRFKVTQAATSGFVYDGLMRPVHDEEGNFWAARLKHATVGAATFGTLAATAHGLDVFGKMPPASSTIRRPFGNEMFNHTFAGAIAGGANAQFDSLLSGKGFASHQDTARGAYTFAIVGASLKGIEKGREVAAKRATEAGLLRTLRQDLTEVPVRAENGRVIDVHEKIMSQPETVLRSDQKTRIVQVLSEARQKFYEIEEALPADHPSKGYQVVNWKHTRGEIDQVLEAAKLSKEKLTPEQIEDAILASIFSDSVKTPQNFIRHHLDGAKAAQELLPRFLDPAKPGNAERIEGIVEAIKEHQIGPPGFMQKMVELNLNIALKFQPTAEQAATIASIGGKVAKPFENVSVENPRVIDFTTAEHQMLDLIGLKDWYVPSKTTRWYQSSRQLINGDSLINYGSPDGWAKIAQIRGPGTIFKDNTIWESLDSAKSSYNDALTVMTPDALPLAEAGLARTQAAVQRVTPEMQRWVDANKQKFGYEANEKVSFWDKDAEPLRYPEKGEILESRDALRLDFARQLRDHMVQLLRNQQGNYSDQP